MPLVLHLLQPVLHLLVLLVAWQLGHLLLLFLLLLLLLPPEALETPTAKA